MKKTITILLALTLLFCLFACTSNKNAEDSDNDDIYYESITEWEEFSDDSMFSVGSTFLEEFNLYHIDLDDNNLYVKDLDDNIVEERKAIHITVEGPKMYINKKQRLWGRKILGVYDDGTYCLDDWEILSEKIGRIDFSVCGCYAELGFEFTIYAGTDWPYSACFITAEDKAPETVYIECGGSPRIASIKIIVDDDTIVNDNYCDSHDSFFKPYLPSRQ